MKAIDSEIDDAILGGRKLSRRERWALQEGLLSQKWQSWCGFCRSVLIQSAIGAQTTGGSATTSPHAARSEAELAWLASRASRNQSISNIQPIGGSHLEPTWGDPIKIGLISHAFAMTNEGQLSAGLLSASAETRHLQIVRNATAHINRENYQEARDLSLIYRAGPFEAPSDVMLWEEPTTGEFAYRYWSDRLIIAAKIAVI